MCKYILFIAGKKDVKEGETCMKDFKWKTLGRDHVGNRGIDEKVILNMIVKEEDVEVWTKFKRFMIGSNGRLL